MLRASEETSKCVDKFIVDGACAKIVAFILHHSHLSPLVLLDLVLFHRVESLLSTEASEHIDISTAHGDSMRVSAFVHWTLVSDLILQGQIEASVFLGRGASSSYQNLARSQGDGSRALIEFAG